MRKRLQECDDCRKKNDKSKDYSKEPHNIEGCILQRFVDDIRDCCRPHNGELHRKEEGKILKVCFFISKMYCEKAECKDQVRKCKNEDQQKANVVFRLLEVLEDNPERAQT